MKKIMVWDPFVRIFHWTLVISVSSQFATAEEFNEIHAKVGYLIILLVLGRIVWGFIGTEHAKFKDFIYPPKDVILYLSGLINKKARHYVGHNPAGGAMVVVLLIFLLLTTLTGLKTYGERGKGPLAHIPATAVSAAHADEGKGDYENHEHYQEHRHGAHAEHDEIHGAWKEIHEFFAHIIVVLVVVHVLGVGASSYAHSENLIWPMITGQKKKILSEDQDPYSSNL